jgi:pyruvate formate lyase activating enzyme
LYNYSEIPIIARIPLIPGITATEKNLAGFSQFLQKHGVTACCLMPYNPMWQDKAVKNGIGIKYSHPAFMSEKEEASCIQVFTSSKDPGQKGPALVHP